MPKKKSKKGWWILAIIIILIIASAFIYTLTQGTILRSFVQTGVTSESQCKALNGKCDLAGANYYITNCQFTTACRCDLFSETEQVYLNKCGADIPSDQMECTPNSFDECLSNYVYRKCNADGFGYSDLRCPSGTICRDSKGGCVKEQLCTPNSIRCDGNRAYICNSLGDYESTQNCGTTQECISGSGCQTKSNPETCEQVCIDVSSLQICENNQAKVEFCGENEECAGNICKPMLGTSCGTVSPDSRDECCKNKYGAGFVWQDNECKIPGESTICPSVCAEMYILKDNKCEYDACGSGCGPNEITTFETKSDCEKNIEKDDTTEECTNWYEWCTYNNTEKTSIIVSGIIGVIILIIGGYLLIKRKR